MSSRLRLELKSTVDLERLARAPLHPDDRRAVERELATRYGGGAESKDQMGLFEEEGKTSNAQRPTPNVQRGGAR